MRYAPERARAGRQAGRSERLASIADRTEGTVLGASHGMATPSSGRRRPSEAPSIQVHQPPDVVTLTHLRWDFVFQRPQTC